MITNKYLRDREIYDFGGRNILDYQHGWINNPCSVEEMLRAYKCGTLAKTRYVLDRIKQRIELMDAEMNFLQEVEKSHGTGCLMDLNDPVVKSAIENGFLNKEMKNAMAYAAIMNGESKLGVII